MKQTFLMRTWDPRIEGIPEWVEHEYDDADGPAKEMLDEVARHKKDLTVVVERFMAGGGPFVVPPVVEFPPRS